MTTAPRRSSLRPTAVAALLALHGAAWALPEGNHTAFGQVSVTRPDGNTMLVQQGSARAGIDWQRFAIGAGETVRFAMPDSRSIVVNRVLGQDPSAILGRLQANGQVFLVNPRGIVFGAGAQVDVGALVASSLSLSPADAAAGRWRFGDAGGAGAVRNDGKIVARDGTVVLAGPQVANRGAISATRIGLAAAAEVTVDLEGDGLIVFASRAADAARLDQLGTLTADQGRVELRASARGALAQTVLNLRGAVLARGFAQQGGEIVIDGGASGITEVAAVVDASGRQGGRVAVSGEWVGLGAAARLDASGAEGGGQVRVGGDWRGAALADVGRGTAARVSVAPGAVLDASAGERGDGGRVVVWSDEATRFAGQVAARGGRSGGHGGEAEVSGKGFLDWRGGADLRAPRGRAGALLLDPTNLSIEAAAPDLNDDGSSGDDLAGSSLGFGAPGVNSRITAAAVVNQLASGAVVLQAGNDITVNASIDSPTANALTLSAGNNIDINASIRLAGGALTLSSNDPGSPTRVSSGRVAVSGNIDLGSGAFTLTHNGGTGLHDLFGNVTSGSATISGDTVLAGRLEAPQITVAAGRLNLSGFDVLPDTAQVQLAAPGAVLSVSSAETFGALQGVPGSGLELLGGDVTVGDARPSSFGGDISGAGGLVKRGPGTLILAGAGNYSGATTVQGGTLQIGNGGNTGSLGSGAVQNDGLLVFQRADAVVVPNDITGTGTLRQAGTGTLALGGSNSYTGATELAAGTLAITGVQSIPGSSTLAFGAGAGALRVDGSGIALVGPVTISAAGAVFDTAGNDLALAGPVTGPGALIKLGAGNLALGSPGNSYQGGTQLVGGTLSTTVANALPDIGTVAVGPGRTLTLGGNDLVGAIDLAAGSTLAGSGFTLTSSAGSYVLGGVTVDANLGPGALAVSASSTLNGTAAATAVTVTAGTLTLGAPERLADNAAVTLAGAGAGLALSGSETIGSLAGAPGSVVAVNAGSFSTGGNNASTTHRGTIQGSGDLVVRGLGSFTLAADNNYLGSTTVLPGATLAVGEGTASGTLGLGPVSNNGTLILNRSDTLLLANPIGGTGTLRQAGNGVLQLAGANTYTGATELDGGTLALTGPSGLGNTSALVFGGGTLRIDANAVTLNAPVLASGSGANIDTNGNDFALGGPISGPGRLFKAGAGDLALGNAANSYGGGTVVAGGTLSTTAANVLPDAGSVSLGPGRSLVLGGNDTVASLALGAGSAVGGPGFTLTATNGDYTLPGVTVDANLGAGTLTVTASSILNGTSAAGNVNLLGGTLALGAANRLIGNAAVDLAGAGAGLAVSGSESLGSLAGVAGSTVTVGRGVLATGGNNANTTFAGTLQGGGGLAVGGSATLALTGTNTTQGGTLIGSAATLVVGDGITGGGLGTGAVTNNGALRFQRADDLVVTNPIAGTGSLRQAGGGLLVLGGANSYTGATEVFTGTLALADPAALGNTSSLLLAGTTLRIDAPSVLLAAPVNLVGGTATVDTGANALTLAGTVGGSGALAKAGTGTLTLAGSGNNYLGVTTVQAGTLATQGNDALPDGGVVIVADVATLSVGGDESITQLTLAGTLDGTGRLSATTLALSGAQVRADLGGGTLNSRGNTLIAASAGVASVNVLDGTLDVGNGGPRGDLGTAAVSVNNGATLSLNRSGSLALANAISGAGTVQQDGAGTVLVSGSIGTAALQANRGTLSLASGTALGAGTAMQVATPATLDLGVNSTTVASLDLAGTLAGSGTLTAPAVTLRAATVDANLGGGTLDQLSGTSTLTGTSAANVLRVNGGTLALNASNRLAASAAVDVAAGATLALGTNDQTVASLALAGNLDGSGTLSAASTTLAGATVNANLGGGSLGSIGPTRLNGRTAADTINLDGGTLTLGAAARLTAAPALNAAANTTLVLAGDESVGALAGIGTVALGAATLSAGAGNVNSNFGGVLAGSGGLRKIGNGTLTLAGANGYTGATTVAAGTLALAAAQRLAATTAATVQAGATLALGGDQTLGSLAGGGSVTLGASTLTTGGSGASTGFDGVIAGTGGLTKAGLGTLTLGGANTYTGATTVNAGTLATTAPDRLADASAVSVAANSRLLLGGAETIASLAGAGGVTINAGTLATGGSDASTRFDGVIDGAGSLSKTGSGSFTLAGANTYGGTTAVTSGTLAFDGAAARAGAGVISVGPAGTLAADGGAAIANPIALNGGTLASQAGSGRFDGAVTLGANATLGGSGSLTVAGAVNDGAASFALSKTGSGTVLLTAANAFDGGTTVNAGTLALAGGSGRAGSGALGVRPGATLDLRSGADLQANAVTLAGGTLDSSLGDGSAGALTLSADSVLSAGAGSTLTVQGALEGAGGFTKAGAGTVLLLAPSHYAGDTTVADGTLRLQATELLPATTNLRLLAPATLDIGRFDQRVATLSLAGTVLGTGLFNAATTTLAGGTVDTRLGDGVLNVTDTTTLNNSAASTSVNVATGTLTLTSTGALTGTPVLTVANAATLQLDSSQTVAQASIAGTLAGSGTLNATGGYQLDGASVSANLGSGTLTSTGNSTLGGSAAVSSLAVQGGSLQLTGSGLLANAPAATVAGGASLGLGGNETVSAIAGSGALNLGSATLTTQVGNAGARFDGTISGSGNLVKEGSGTLTLAGGNTYTGATRINTGTLATSGANRLGDGSAVEVAANAALALGGNERIGSLAGAGSVALGSATLTTGANGSSTVFAGTLAGSGGLTKVGDGTLTLAGANQFSGPATVSGGTLATQGANRLGTNVALAVGNGAALALGGSETLASVALDGGTLRAAQAGGGERLAASSLTSTGSSRIELPTAVAALVVADGTLAVTGSAGRLANAPAVTVRPGATLTLASNETLGVVTNVGTLVAPASLSAASISGAGSLRFDGQLSSAAGLEVGGALVALSPTAAHALQAGGDLVATNAANDLGSGALALRARSAQLRSAGAVLNLGAVALGGGSSRLESAGTLDLGAELRLDAGSLALVAHAARSSTGTDPMPGRTMLLPGTDRGQSANRLQYALPAISQSGGRIVTAAGTALQVLAPNGGSVQLDRDGNAIAGTISARAGAGGDFAYTSGRPDAEGALSLADRLVISSRTPLQVAPGAAGERGLDADVIALRAPSLATPNGGAIHVRLPFAGAGAALPGLVLDLTPVTADDGPQAFGSLASPLTVSHGRLFNLLVSVTPEQALSLPLSLGVYLACQGASCAAQPAYAWGAATGAVPVFYNGVQITDAPPQNNAITANTSLLENARRALFEEAVRTENVAPRLRAGVIAEVGAGRPATEGRAGLARPATCEAQPGSMGCP